VEHYDRRLGRNSRTFPRLVKRSISGMKESTPPAVRQSTARAIFHERPQPRKKQPGASRISPATFMRYSVREVAWFPRSNQLLPFSARTTRKAPIAVLTLDRDQTMISPTRKMTPAVILRAVFKSLPPFSFRTTTGIRPIRPEGPLLPVVGQQRPALGFPERIGRGLGTLPRCLGGSR